MKKYFTLALAILLTATAAMAANQEGKFSLSPVVGGYTFDGRQHLKTNMVDGLRAGYNFTKHIGFEVVFDYVNTSPDNGGNDINMFRYGGELLYHFLPDNALVPYVAAGFAGSHANGDVSSSKNRGIFDYGIGAKYFITESFALRADIRHLITTGSQLYNNVEYTVGAHIPFGGIAKAAKPIEAQPAAVAAPAPVAQPTPAPVPAPAKVAAVEPVKKETPSYSAAVQRVCNKPAILNIRFDFDKSDIKPQYHSELKIDGDFLKEFPGAKSEISGHTDSIGSEDYNQKLSERRAISVKKYLVERFGIDAARINTKGYGESKPIDSNKTAAGRAKNRRIEAIFDCN